MDEVTVDCLNLRNTNFFSKLSKFYDTSRAIIPKNILEYAEEELFSWDHEEHCLIALRTKSLMVNDYPNIVQKLRPSEMILEEVVQIILNRQITRVAICCVNSVYVLDLPPVMGRVGAFRSGATDLICSCRRVVHHYKETRVLRVHWHPDIEQDSYLALLTSDNVILIIDVRVAKYTDLWMLSARSEKRIPSLDSIGEIAVDFHFIPLCSLKHISPVYSRNKPKERMEWPALILHRNGDIVMIDLVVKHQGSKYGKTTPPLLMYPSAEDNYGVDCCALLILEAPLPVVVVASKTGIIYHCIFLNHPASDYQNYDIKNSDKMMPLTNNSADAIYVLHVIESVELDIGLYLGSNFDDPIDEIISSPISLVRDINITTRYFAVHAAGVHSVNLPIIHELRIFFSKSYKSVELPPHALLDFRRNKCVVEYAVCSQISGSKPCPVLGVVCIDAPTCILVVLFPDKVLSLHITSWFISPQHLCKSLGNSEEGLMEEVKVPAFQDDIKNILWSESKNTPIFKTSEPSPQQCLELLARATSYFRENTIPRQEQAAQVILTKVRMVINMKERQKEDLKKLVEIKSELQDKAGCLAEKYEDINEKQIELIKRAEQVLLAVKTRDGGLTRPEKNMLDNLSATQKLIDILKLETNAIRSKEAANEQLARAPKQWKPSELYLPSSRLQTISKTLARMGGDISNLVTRIDEAENELDFEASFLNKHSQNN